MTDTYYKQLQELHEEYGHKGLEIMAFPSNQFGEQEPGDSFQIKDFARMRYKAEYRLFEKIDVNGPNAHPVFSYLRRNSELWNSNKKQAWKIPWNWSHF